MEMPTEGFTCDLTFLRLKSNTVWDVDFNPACYRNDGHVLLYEHVPPTCGCGFETTNAIDACEFQQSGPGPR
jgi:hypothetical protein